MTMVYIRSLTKKILRGQGTFDSEENAVLYQNYKEKALEIDSDEDADSKEHKEDRIIIEYKPLRSTWSQLSVVRKNGLSQSITQEERKRQEAMFEVLSSEHSYLLSLEILIRMFKNSKQLSSTMTKTENHHLFSNITDVCEASKKWMAVCMCLLPGEGQQQAALWEEGSPAEARLCFGQCSCGKLWVLAFRRMLL
ncbi:rho guanine nucleotide exchange factor 26 [Pelobates cultripes]|uniref:Rho guanine nucleotide exchange factor 26 n=1 Tax=Pelobates cultripes TaxID=61616 RepID=A0AAD1RBL6_PELCU|nr:rho guanine nucleotide exchange factor 26 [Pelobates cultripes]